MKNKKYYFNKFYRFLKNKNLQIIILAILVVFDAVMIAKFLNCSKEQEHFFYFYDFSQIKKFEGAQTFGRLLDGIFVGKEATSTRPLAVLIENHFESWPQTGLAEASLVYEFLTEGGITRFLAFYDASSTVEKIGPVRSCRPYFLNAAEEFQALFAHVGGSPDCLALLKNRQYDIYNLDEYAKTEYFWRDKKRSAPHNVYTSIDLLKQYLVDKEIGGQKSFEPWKFKDEPQLNRQNDTYATATVSNISVDFSTYTYNPKWLYDEKNNEYIRYVTDEPHSVFTGKDLSAVAPSGAKAGIRAKNIVVQYAKARVLDSIGRLSFQLEGRGEALIFQDGQVILGYWKKPDRSSRTKFYFETGEEVEFNRGLTWVEVLPKDRKVDYE